MSLQLVRQFQKRLEDMVQYGGTRNESSVRSAFQQLLGEWAEAEPDNVRLITELGLNTEFGTVVRPDGTVKDSLQQPRGYWESKDEKDTLDEEIQKKFAAGYPRDNIIFEDTQTAVLIQQGEEVQRVSMSDAKALHGLLTLFFDYEPPQVGEFRAAIEQFRAEMPKLLQVLRDAVEDAVGDADYIRERDTFIEIGRKSINPEFSAIDAREMVIQHILTGDIFRKVFDNAQYHDENNIAQQLEKLTKTFYKGQVRRDISKLTGRYYGAIQAAAAQIADHHEKQKFLKALYENFYRSYNPAGADRLGIFYTPNEIVSFMIRATDALLERHFNKSLAEKDVDILDPATGTGTFITELIDYLPKSTLEYKYRHELHCNELALLPYYIANLNIEATYAQKMGRYLEFENIVLVDTLDNTGFGIHAQQESLFGGVSAENLERVQRQNARPVRVIIGNPPYRANQANENDNNKNREYAEIDRRIKATYIAASSAQKTKLYDMYSRFLRWATDRLKDEGIVAFVMNRSFVDSRTFDGFRKVAAEEFSHIYIVDLGGDVRANPKLSGPKHNVFAIQTGIAIAFLVREQPHEQPKRKADTKAAVIEYIRRPEMETARAKLEWLATAGFERLAFDRIRPDKHHNWLGQAEHDWSEFLPVVERGEMKASVKQEAATIFREEMIGISTNRDEWVFDQTKSSLVVKVEYFIDEYNTIQKNLLHAIDKFPENSRDKLTEKLIGTSIKWSDTLKRRLKTWEKIKFEDTLIVDYLERPFCTVYYYAEKTMSDRLTTKHLNVFGDDLTEPTKTICISGLGSSKPFSCLATDKPFSLDLIEKTQGMPILSGRTKDNITKYALKAFQTHYGNTNITREDIFHYVYAALHHPAYREKYALNLRQEFPRIPFYGDFAQWTAWGRELMALHIGFESVEPYPLQRTDKPPKNDTPEALALAQKAKLKVLRDKAKVPTGEIELDGLTTLSGVPREAWEYRLGNRSALEWVLERHKERRPRDPTIREKFDTYRFVGHKERVIDLLARVTTVSVETVRILGEMPEETV